MKSKTRFFWYLIAISCLILFLLMLVSSVIDIAEKLGRIHFVIPYVFYALSGILFFFGVINPLIIILRSPSLKIATTLDPDSNLSYRIYKKVKKNMIKHNEFSKDDIQMLQSCKNTIDLRMGLVYVFDKYIKKEMNNIIISHAKTVMISTAICQNARFDMITTFTVNLRMIKMLVQKCGYRPDMKNLSKLTLQVFMTSLIAEGLENANIEDMLPKNTLNFLGEIPFIKPLLESLIQGVANALTTLRIGCVTRRYLFSDGGLISKDLIRQEAFLESVKILPIVIKDTLAIFPKKILKFFSKYATYDYKEAYS